MPATKPRKFTQGHPKTVRAVNENNRGFVQGGFDPGAGVNKRTMGGQALNDPSVLRRDAAPVSKVTRRAKINSSDGDVLLVQFFDNGDGSLTGAEFPAAKPYLLRRTPFDGETISYINGDSITYTYTNDYTRTHDDGTDSADFTVYPTWFVGEVVKLEQVNTGILYNSSPVVWEVVDTSARQWTEVT